MSNGSPSDQRASIKLSGRNSISFASSGFTRMKPPFAPVPRKKWRRWRSGLRPRESIA